MSSLITRIILLLFAAACVLYMELSSDAAFWSLHYAVSQIGPTPSPQPTVSTFNDEFAGPFPSWQNVKTVYGATGNGVSDDTTAIQNALTANLNGGVIYFPAGTYLITATLTIPSGAGIRLVGADPATAIIKWNGAAGGTMLLVTGGQHQSLSERLTWDGAIAAGGNAHYLIEMNSSNATDRMVVDSILQNTDSTGIGIYMAGTDDTNNLFLRNTYNNTHIGIEPTLSNDLENYVFWSTFNNNAVALQSAGGATGNFHAYYNYFNGSTTADIDIVGAMLWSARGNVSIGSKQFFLNSYSAVSPTTIENNRVVNSTTNAAISVANPGLLALVDNQITNTSSAGPYVSVNAAGSNTSFLSLGNQYNIAPASAETEGTGGTNNYLAVDNVQSASISTAAPAMPPIPPNCLVGGATLCPTARPLIDIAAGTGTASTDTTNVQTAITGACTAPNLGKRTVVHLPGSTYSINTTLTIPGGCDLQLIGDGMCGLSGSGGPGHSALNWTGTSGGNLLVINAPGKVSMSELCLLGNAQYNPIVIHSADVAGSRIQVMNGQAYDGSGPLVSASGLTNTQLNWYDILWYVGTQQTPLFSVTGTGVAGVPSRVAIFGDSGGSNGPETSPTLPQGLHVTNQGNLVEQDFWWENGPMYAIYENTGDTGSVVMNNGNWGLVNATGYGSTTGNCTVTSAFIPTKYLNGFTGTSLTGPGFSSCIGPNQYTYTNDSGTTDSDVAWLFRGNYTSYWTATPQTSTIGLYGPRVDTANTGSTAAMANQGTTNAALVRSAWALNRATVPSADTALPSGVDDVQIFRTLIRQNVATAITVSR